MAACIIDFELGRAIRRRRRIVGMTQSDLAAVVGVGFQTIQKYEEGSVCLNVSRLIKVANGLGVKASELIANVEDR